MVPAPPQCVTENLLMIENIMTRTSSDNILDNYNGFTYNKKMYNNLFEPLLYERVASVKTPDAKIDVKI